MKTTRRWIWIVLGTLAFSCTATWAGELSIPNEFTEVTLPNTFEADTPAVANDVNENFEAVKMPAEEVNENFNAVKTEVDDNDERITALEDRIANLENQLATLLALAPYLTVTSDTRGPLIQISEANVQIVNGEGATGGIPTGLGNLIVGYDEGDLADKTGSHYIVLGTENSYDKFGGIVAGSTNTASGQYSSVCGGHSNTASGDWSSVSGGYRNTTSGTYSSVSGGYDNTASGTYSSVSGGFGNTASGDWSSVSGGSGNSASGHYSGVSGGDSREAVDDYNWAAGSLLEDE